MSRLPHICFALVAISLQFAVAGNVRAQNAESAADRRVQDMVTLQQRQVAVDDEGCVKYPKDRVEIVVCGTRGVGDEHRIPGRERLESVQSTDNGIPQAPDIAGPGIFRGPATISGGCFLQKWGDGTGADVVDRRGRRGR